MLADKYRLVSLLGRGGMGAVWRAERLEWGSLVAVKLMERAGEARPDVLARFQREARLAANLRSSHVVQVLDDGCDAPTGTPFIVMELLPGETLAQRLARVQRLSPAETSRIVTHVARALALAHELGMVHRDLKPDNIFLVPNDDEETAKVLDFGIAKWQRQLMLDAPTSTGIAIGTPSYMSPEQIKDSKRADHRSDLWSLALIASECLTGRRAFDADNLLGLALQICNEQPPLPSSLAGVPAGFDEWFERATARQLERRFGSARELAEALRGVCCAAVGAPGPLPERVLASSAAALDRTELLLRAPPGAGSTEGLTRTHRAVAAFRSGRRPRALAGVVTAFAVAAAGLAVRSELAAHDRRSVATDIERAGALALRPLAREIDPPSAVASSPALETAAPAEGAAASEGSAAVPLAGAAEAPTAGALPGERGDTPPRRAALPEHGAAPPTTAGVPPARASELGAAPALGSAALVSGPAASGDGSAAAPGEPANVAAAPEAVSGGAAASAGAMAISAAAPAGPEPSAVTLERPFDREAARVALEQAAAQAQSCRPPGGPHGRGRVQVRFEPSGRVSAAWLVAPQFDNTVAGSCVLMVFRRATVPEFTGDPALVIKSFEVP